ncbi:hypothetical protein TNCV_4077001 [Trichonephila clavipes]|nr:hypothetical protein TNCV_4077001 [Trichonephila clavipes]
MSKRFREENFRGKPEAIRELLKELSDDTNLITEDKSEKEDFVEVQNHEFTVGCPEIFCKYSRTLFIRMNSDRSPFGYAIVWITENRMRSMQYMVPDTIRILKIITFGKRA